MRKTFLITLILIALVIINSVTTIAAVTTKECSNTRNFYSWVGVWIFSITVKGWYDSDGTKIVRYGATDCMTNTFVWTATNKSSQWVSKLPTSGSCRAKATFVLGVATQWVTIGVQSCDVEIYAYASP